MDLQVAMLILGALNMIDEDPQNLEIEEEADTSRHAIPGGDNTHLLAEKMTINQETNMGLNKSVMGINCRIIVRMEEIKDCDDKDFVVENQEKNEAVKVGW